MPYEQGLHDWRVYSAEEAVGHDRVLTIEECQQLVYDAKASIWWKEWFPDAPPIDVVVGGDETPELGLIGSYAAPHDSYIRPTRWTISLHPQMLTARVLLHEMAHCVAPHFVVEDIGPRRRKGELLVKSHRNHLDHGRFFTAALAVITDNVLPGDNGELAAATAHFEAPTAPSDELRLELNGQPAIVADEEAYHAEIMERLAVKEVQHQSEPGEPVEEKVPPVGWAPDFHWGFHLWNTRRSRYRRANGRVLSQQRLAEAISAVAPCTARHISQLEHSSVRPNDALQLKRAMCATISLGLDPIWTRYNLRLTRWDCGEITMEEARSLNPDWADLVDHINQLLQQMPPRWHVEGAR
jgi:hypothetical protein